MKLKILFAVFVAAVISLFVYSQTSRTAFAPAADFPKQAVLYVQIADLPALIKLWNDSPLKEKYLAGENFKDFTNRHLGRKLASRWQEFSTAAGFPLDLEMLGNVTGNRAAVAVYDVGKLEFVFIAPVSDEIFAATKFAQNRTNFTAETLTDGTTVHRVKVEADRGRQKQELIFTQAKGRFILTTSEKLLAQTLYNINGEKSKSSLADAPSFALLSNKIEPHLATVWLDQTALNDDYYFKHYWLMSDVNDLKNLRAGMFDFEMQEGKLIERRRFLLNKAIESAPLENSDVEKMLTFLPPDMPYYRLQAGNPERAAGAVDKSIFARMQLAPEKSRKYYAGYSSFDADDNYSRRDYESLGSQFDETIDAAENDEATEKREEIKIDFSKVLKPAEPQSVLTFTQPKILPAPLFARFQRAAVFNLAAPASFNPEAFEAAIRQKFIAQMMANTSDAPLNWETITADNFSRRELKLPLLGCNVAYVLRGNMLILANEPEFLRQSLTGQNPPLVEKQNSSFSALTVINFTERENNYDKIFTELDRKNSTADFFTGDIGSLLDSISEVKKIEIKENYRQEVFAEEITLSY